MYIYRKVYGHYPYSPPTNSQEVQMHAETALMNEIRVALSKDCIIFRGNVGKVRMADGRFFDTGLPKGFSDLFGFRKSDGRMVFVEVKTAAGRVRPEQMQFLETVKKYGCLAGVARSVEDALAIIKP